MADLANIDRSYMSSVERGLRNVSVLNVARIAGALEVPVWELLHPHARRVGAPRHRGHAARALEADPATGNPETGPVWEPRDLSLG